MTASRTKLLAMAAAGMLLLAGVPAPAVADSSLAVATGNASTVTADSATLNGNLTDLGNSDNASVWFTYWKASDPANTTQTTANTTLETAGPFNETVTGLESNTTYEFRAHAEGSTGNTSTGSIVSFTTATADDGGLSIGVQEGAGRVTISVTNAENGTPVAGANVSVTSDDPYNGTGDYVTGDDGTVSIPAPEGNRTVTATIRAEADGLTGETTVTLHGHDGEGPEETPFGISLAAFVQSMKGLGVDGPLGQVISSFATENNPGADNKPEHAGPPEAVLDTLFDDPEDANETDGDRGPPAHAGPPDDNETETEDDDGGHGPPDHAKNDEHNSSEEGDDEVETEDDEEDEEDDENEGPGNNGKAKGHGND